jgi:colicin import membrane protein
MKPSDKDKSGGTSFWGVFLSIALHAAILILVLFWGFSGASRNSGSSGPIEVSLSGIGPGGGQNSNPVSQPNKPPQEPKAAAEPPKQEPPKVETKEEVKEAPPEPEKKEPPKEPEKVEVKKEEPKEKPKEEKPKEVVKKEPEKKEVIPLEPEKKEVKKKEEPKKTEPPKEVKKEVAEKPKPTEKPKTEAKKTPASNKKNLESEKNKVLEDIKRQRVLEELKNSSEESAQPKEEVGEEQKLAMADSGDLPQGSRKGPGDSAEGSHSSGSSSSVNPVLLQIYTDKVHQRISRSWRIPPGVPTDGNLEAGLFFRVDQSGRVFDVRVDRSSGNSAFDEYCVSAIYKSAPLPPPPLEFAKAAQNDGITVSFKNVP